MGERARGLDELLERKLERLRLLARSLVDGALSFARRSFLRAFFACFSSFRIAFFAALRFLRSSFVSSSRLSPAPPATAAVSVEIVPGSANVVSCFPDASDSLYLSASVFFGGPESTPSASIGAAPTPSMRSAASPSRSDSPRLSSSFISDASNSPVGASRRRGANPLRHNTPTYSRGIRPLFRHAVATNRAREGGRRRTVPGS